MTKRPARTAEPKPDRDTPVKIDVPFEEAVRRLLQPLDETNASDESDEDSKGDSR